MLRRLQLAGELSFQYVASPDSHITLSLGLPSGTESAAAAADLARAQELLGLPAGKGPYRTGMRIRRAVQLVGGETRSIILIHAGKRPKKSVYASVSYRSARFWIDDADFDSKYVLTVVLDLMALAEETDTSHAPVVTVPAS